MKIDTQSFELGLSKFKLQYQDLLPFYCDTLMNWPEASIDYNFRVLRSDPFYVLDTIQLLYSHFDPVYKQMEDGFRRFKYYFPTLPTPKITTVFTEFFAPTATNDQHLLLSLEFFLGKDYPTYKALDIPEFIARRLSKPYIPIYAATAWIDQVFDEFPKQQNRFLDKAVEEGKKIYLLKALYPQLADTLLSGWSSSQLKWLNENQFQSWTYFIEKNYLYNTNVVDFAPLIIDAPFTSAPGVPPESAPRIGVYAGWMIVNEYMKKNQDVSIQELILNPNADLILKQSGYRP